MPKRKAIPFATLIPKSEAAKLKLSYHGDRWLIRGEQDGLRFSVSNKGKFLKLMSKDGTKCLLVKEQEDPDFIVRLSY